MLAAATDKITMHLVASLDAHMSAGAAHEADDALLYELKCHQHVQRRHVAGFTVRRHLDPNPYANPKPQTSNPNPFTLTPTPNPKPYTLTLTPNSYPYP